MKWLVIMLFIMSMLQLAMIRILTKDIAQLYKQDVTLINHIIELK